MTAKDFLEKQIIPDIQSLVREKPYVAFALISIGIEFLGKGLQVNKSWDDDSTKASYSFNLAIKKLFSTEYQRYSKDNKLYHSFRCGFAHNLLQKPDIALHSTGDNYIKDGIIHLSCEKVFEDFNSAATKLLREEKYKAKMDHEFFGIYQDDAHQPYTGSTYEQHSRVITSK